ncbi:MAG TPA: undecaprenyl-diphosphatase UppP [Anaerolineales bacterium]
MNILQALILGIVQGLTEYLPISSSAHLVIVPYLLQWKIPEAQVFPFDVLVQLGTLLAVIVYFWQDLWSIIRNFVSDVFRGQPFATYESRMGWFLILATIPAGVIGLLLKSKVEAAFNSAQETAIFLFVTALLLFLAERFGRKQRDLKSLTWVDALWIGFFQAISIFPGISRSGSTITGGMTRQLTRPAAARFSFLMSVPVMLAAGLVSVLDLRHATGLGSFLPLILVGFIAAAVVGYLAIRWLLHYVINHSLYVFSLYCAALGVIVLLVSYVRG